MDRSKIEIEKVERVPIIPIILSTAIISFVGPIWQALISVFPNWITNSLGVSICNIGLATAPFLLMLIVAPLSYIKSLKGRIDIKMLGYLYIASIISSHSINYPWAVGQRYLFASRYVEQTLADEIVPWFMAPSAEVCRVMGLGGPVNWSEWIVPIIWWWTMNGLFAIFFICIATIFRRLWIDLEKVPFPQTLVVNDLALNAMSGFRWSRAFFIGVIIGLAFQIPVTLTGLFPWFPDIYSVKVNTCAHLTRYFVAGDILATIPGMMAMNYNPAVAAIGYLVPLSVLFSTWFFAIVYIVAVQIAYSFGYYTGITELGSCGRMWCHPSPNSDPPLKFGALGIGAFLMIGIMHLVLNRRYISETFKLALRKSKSENSENVDNYRAAYLILAITFAILIFFWIASSLSPLEAFLYPIAAFLLFFPAVRIYGLAGVHDGGFGSGFLLYRLLYPVASRPVTTQQWILAHFYHPYNGGDSPYSWGCVSVTSFASYKMASLCGIDSRKALGAMTISAIISPVLSLIAFIWIMHTLGGANVGIWKNWFEGIGERFHLVPDWWTAFPAAEPWIEYVVVGAIIGGALSWAHAKFIWFPLEPSGYVLGTTFVSSLKGLWIQFFVVWILKIMTMRIGGAKLYEQHGVPLASGIVTGFMIGTVFGGILWIVRFFIPF